MKTDTVTELLRITQESLDRQARMVEILLQLARTVNFALKSPRPAEPTARPIHLVQQ